MAASRLALPPLPSLKQLLGIYRLQAKKQLSQNFLLNESVLSTHTAPPSNRRWQGTL